MKNNVTDRREIQLLGPRGEIVKINARNVNSSNVEWIGWPQTGEPLLLVQFTGGARYAYLGVSRQKAVAVAYGRSVGESINKRIKPHHEVVKLR